MGAGGGAGTMAVTVGGLGAMVFGTPGPVVCVCVCVRACVRVCVHACVCVYVCLCASVVHVGK